MRSLIIHSLLGLMVLGCSARKNVVVSGEYGIVPKTLSDRLFLSKMNSDGRIVGSSLNLSPDSTFSYTTCGNQMTGSWSKKDDAILLYVATNAYRTDSMKMHPAAIPTDPIIFHFRNAQLYRVFPSDGPGKIVELLTKKN